MDVNFPDQRVGSTLINVADFETVVEQKLLMQKIELGKRLANTPMLFVIDDSLNSLYNNIVMIGTIMTCSGATGQFERNHIKWNIKQNKEL